MNVCDKFKSKQKNQKVCVTNLDIFKYLIMSVNKQYGINEVFNKFLLLMYLVSILKTPIITGKLKKRNYIVRETKLLKVHLSTTKLIPKKKKWLLTQKKK